MFKKGDRVLCVEGFGKFPRYGSVYTVFRYVDGKKLLLEENFSYCWFDTRFILATPLIEALV
jgi:hypothetical protein